MPKIPTKGDFEVFTLRFMYNFSVDEHGLILVDFGIFFVFYPKATPFRFVFGPFVIFTKLRLESILGS